MCCRPATAVPALVLVSEEKLQSLSDDQRKRAGQDLGVGDDVRSLTETDRSSPT